MLTPPTIVDHAFVPDHLVSLSCNGNENQRHPVISSTLSFVHSPVDSIDRLAPRSQSPSGKGWENLIHMLNNVRNITVNLDRRPFPAIAAVNSHTRTHRTVAFLSFPSAPYQLRPVSLFVSTRSFKRSRYCLPPTSPSDIHGTLMTFEKYHRI